MNFGIVLFLLQTRHKKYHDLAQIVVVIKSVFRNFFSLGKQKFTKCFFIWFFFDFHRISFFKSS